MTSMLLHVDQRVAAPSPKPGSQILDLPVGHRGQPGQHVTEIGKWVEAAPTALDDGVDDGSALTGSGFADEEPVLPADGGGTDGVFEEVVDLQPPIFKEDEQRGPCRLTKRRYNPATRSYVTVT